MEFILEREKETPGTIRYREVGEAERPLTIYLLKVDAKELGSPKRIKVTIEKAE